MKLVIGQLVVAQTVIWYAGDPVPMAQPGDVGRIIAVGIDRQFGFALVQFPGFEARVLTVAPVYRPEVDAAVKVKERTNGSAT